MGISEENCYQEQQKQTSKQMLLKPETQLCLTQDIWPPFPNIVSTSGKPKAQHTAGQVGSAS